MKNILARTLLVRALLSLMLLGSVAHAQQLQVPLFNGVRLGTRSTAPCSIGQACLWRNGLTLNWRKSDGSDLALGGGGGAGTFAASYSTGTTAADQTPLITAAKGPVIFKANAGATGALLQSQTSGAVSLFSVTDNGSNFLYAPAGQSARLAGDANSGAFVSAGPSSLLLGSSAGTSITVTSAAALPGTDATFTLGNAGLRWGSLLQGNDSVGIAQTAGITLSNNTAATAGAATQKWSPGLQLTGQQWNGAASVAVDWMMQTKPVTGSASASGVSLMGRYNGGAWAEMMNVNVNSLGNQFTLSAPGPAGANTSIDLSSGQMNFNVGGSTIYTAGTVIAPLSDLGATSGGSTHRWTETWSRRYAGVEQTIAAAATITLDPASGETIRVTLSGTAVTTINAGTGYPGEHMTVEFIQDGTGGRTVAGWSASFKIAGGVYTAGDAANKRGVLTFAWDSVASAWVEQSRATNVS